MILWLEMMLVRFFFICGVNAIDSNYSILVAEAWGRREGIRGVLSLGFNNIYVEGDNLAVIQTVNKVWKIPWSINALISDACEDLKKFNNVHIGHAFREANYPADWMANRGHAMSNLCIGLNLRILRFPRSSEKML